MQNIRNVTVLLGTVGVHALLLVALTEQLDALVPWESNNPLELKIILELDNTDRKNATPIKRENNTDRALQAALAHVPKDRAPIAVMHPPETPTAEQWAFASTYTNRNSKAYRHVWGKHVRSLMGSAYEGPAQGSVRFEVEIAADGTLARLETLWATSAKVERDARKVIEALPRLPPTPTGKPLVFERTIVFSAHEAEGEPSYIDDCKPEPTAFRNPFAWDGRSERQPTALQSSKASAEALEDCLRQIPSDSIEADEERARRMMAKWHWK